MVNFQDLNFLLKLVACICNICVLILWTMTDNKGIPLHRFWALVLFYHANCGYVIILTVMVILYLLDEPIGGWGQRLFIVIGIVLFLITGIVGLINQLDDNRSGNAMVSAILLIVSGVLLLVDLLKSENVF